MPSSSIVKKFDVIEHARSSLVVVQVFFICCPFYLKHQEKGDDFYTGGSPQKAIASYRHAWKHSAHMGGKALTVLPGGEVQLEFQGLSDTEYCIEASTNLVDWEVIGVVTADPDGTVRFVDPGAVERNMRYYRSARYYPEVEM